MLKNKPFEPDPANTGVGMGQNSFPDRFFMLPDLKIII